MNGQGRTFTNIDGVQLANGFFCVGFLSSFFSHIMKCTSCIGGNEEAIPLLDLSDTSVMKICLCKTCLLRTRKGLFSTSSQ